MEAKAYSYTRFSTGEQENGSSEERQIERAEKYAREERGLKLDSSLKDLGVSGFRGKHRKHGALRDFLDKVENGEITLGSILIIESVARLSREQPSEAIPQFFSLLKHGIEIVSLDYHNKPRCYTESSINDPALLNIYIGEMQRAHFESLRKSDLIKAGWEKNRAEVREGKRKLTKKVPFWITIKINEKDWDYEVNEKSKVIEHIFKLRLSGKGKAAIANELNKRDDLWKPGYKLDEVSNTYVPDPDAKKKKDGTLSKKFKTIGWGVSSIEKILRNPEVIGKYQLYKFAEVEVEDKKTNKKILVRKRVKDGDPVNIPAIAVIDEKLFDDVQEIIERNSKINEGHGGGRKSSNLFKSLLKCGLCKSPLHYDNKGENWQYLKCANKRNGCNMSTVLYKDFEELMFSSFDELDIDKLLPKKSENSKEIKVIDKELFRLKNEKKTIRKIIDNAMERLLQTDARADTLKELREELFQKINDFKKEEVGIEEKIKSLTTKRTMLIQQPQATQDLKEGVRNIEKLYLKCEKVKDEIELKALKTTLNSKLLEILEWIEVYPLRDKKIIIAELQAELDNVIREKNEFDFEAFGKKITKGKGSNAAIEKAKSYFENQILDLKAKIQLEEKHNFAYNTTVEIEGKSFSLQLESKYIEKIRTKFRNSDIIHTDNFKLYNFGQGSEAILFEYPKKSKNNWATTIEIVNNQIMQFLRKSDPELEFKFVDEWESFPRGNELEAKF